jgi:hypothetical protein
MTVLPIANFEVLATLRNPKPPYFTNQSGTVFKIKCSQRVDVLMKLLQFLDLHGALSLSHPQYSPPLEVWHITRDFHIWTHPVQG